MIPWLVMVFVISVTHQTNMKTLGNPIAPINFEFHHRETFIISSKDDNVEEYDYDYGEPNTGATKEDAHIRKRRAAKWSPDYDLYAQWAEEYYAEYESEEVKVAKADESKGELDQLLTQSTANKTAEEVQKELERQKKKKSLIETGLVLGTWGVGIIILICIVRTLVKRFFFKVFCDFCDVGRYKEKTSRLVNNFVPGVYVHKNGEKEFYEPTEEELEAIKEIRKLLFSL